MPIGVRPKDPMNIQDWLTRLLARPAADPLDWESYCVTMGDATWKALWKDIDAAQAYEDGLEAGLRLLQATQQHRARLSPRGYQANQIRLYHSLLAMLDKADRWDVYLAAWESIWTHTSQWLPARGEAPTDGGPRVAPFARRAAGGFAFPPLPSGVPPPKPLPVHFLHTRLRRKALIERKLAHERAGTLHSDRRPMGRDALTAEAIQSRLAQLWESAG
jgi:hypothetical protein